MCRTPRGKIYTWGSGRTKTPQNLQVSTKRSDGLPPGFEVQVFQSHYGSFTSVPRLERVDPRTVDMTAGYHTFPVCLLLPTLNRKRQTLNAPAASIVPRPSQYNWNITPLKPEECAATIVTQVGGHELPLHSCQHVRVPTNR